MLKRRYNGKERTLSVLKFILMGLTVVLLVVRIVILRPSKDAFLI